MNLAVHAFTVDERLKNEGSYVVLDLDGGSELMESWEMFELQRGSMLRCLVPIITLKLIHLYLHSLHYLPLSYSEDQWCPGSGVRQLLHCCMCPLHVTLWRLETSIMGPIRRELSIIWVFYCTTPVLWL